MKRIGIAGGIGSGKSQVTDYLIKKGFEIIDADIIAREIVEPGKETLYILKNTFGNTILNSDGTLNRRALSDIVFNNSHKLEKLNDIMHKEITKEIEARLSDSKDFVFVVAPLFFESNLDKYVDEVWLINADKNQRVQRVMKRDGFDREKTEQIISSQMKDEERLARADVIIANDESIENLHKKIDELLEGGL